MADRPSQMSQDWRSKTKPTEDAQPRGRAGAWKRPPAKTSNNAHPTATPNPTRNYTPDNPDSPAQRDQDPSVTTTVAITSGRRIYIGNLPYSAQPPAIHALFAAANLPLTTLSMSMDPLTGRNPSYCFAELPSAADADAAMAVLDGAELMGRRLKARPCDVPRDARSGRWAPGHLGRETRGSRWKGDRESDVVGTGEGRRLFVGGLPRRESQAAYEFMIRKLFEGFEVRAVTKVIAPRRAAAETDEEKKVARYFGFVEFESAEEARRATEACDGMVVDGLKVRVNIAAGEARGRGEGARMEAEMGVS